MIYWESFAQETGCWPRLHIAASVAAVEHVCVRIDVSTGLRRVRAIRSAVGSGGFGTVTRGRTGSTETEAGPAGLPQGDARSGGKSADGHGPSGSIASVDVRSSARSGTWATTRRVPGTAGWSDGRELLRKVTIRGRPVGKAPLRRSAVFPVARTLRGARSAQMFASAGSGRRKDGGVSHSRLSPARNSERRPGGNRGSSELRGPNGWVCGKAADLGFDPFGGGMERVTADDAGQAKRAGRRIGQGCVPRAERREAERRCGYWILVGRAQALQVMVRRSEVQGATPGSEDRGRRQASRAPRPCTWRLLQFRNRFVAIHKWGDPKALYQAV